MYEPTPHRQDDLAALHKLIATRTLGLLISCGAQGLLANAIPFLLDGRASRLGTLQCHVARANPQWRDLAHVDEALIVFNGPDQYISPSWYATKRETGKVVPTWNYLTVQARGRPRVIEDAQWLRAQIEALTDGQERPRAQPWAVGDAPQDYIQSQLRMIVGVEIEISAIAGKWKVSQNRPAADRAGVIAGLGEAADSDAEAIARAVRDSAP